MIRDFLLAVGFICSAAIAASAQEAASSDTRQAWMKMRDIVPRMLTAPDGVAMDYWACFSPDGQTVLFSRTRDGGKSWELMRVAARGGEPAPFFDSPLPVSATRADWSISGKVA